MFVARATVCLAGCRALGQGADIWIAKERRVSCPICSKPVVAAYRPFCSRRCADVDLARWLNGSYAVPSDDPQDVEEADAALSKTPTRPH